MNMFLHAQGLGVEQMTDSIGSRTQNKIVNNLRTLYKFERAE
jgi:hypothetical protein